MRNRVPFVRPAAVVLAGLCAVTAPAADRQSPVIRISVELIQVDAVVTDSDGHLITDLSPEDFEIRQDGERQTITHLAYVQAGEPWTWRVAPGETPAPPAPAPPRTLVVVFDDLGLSMPAVVQAREALQQVASNLLPTDRVGLVTTGDWDGDLGLTSDARLLHGGILRLRYNPDSRSLGPRAFQARADIGFGGGAALNRDQLLALRSIRTLSDVVEELREVEGRKAVIVVSEGFPELTHPEWLIAARHTNLYPTVAGASDVEEAIRRLGDQATRASVVLHCIDAAGLRVSPLAGDAAASSASTVRLASALRDAGTIRRSAQASLEYLPRETGGLAILDTNDLRDGVEDVLDTLTGYYLIGYAPGEGTFSSRGAFRSIDVNVGRRGARVHTRRGFYAVPQNGSASPTP